MTIQRRINSSGTTSSHQNTNSGRGRGRGRGVAQVRPRVQVSVTQQTRTPSLTRIRPPRQPHVAFTDDLRAPDDVYIPQPPHGGAPPVGDIPMEDNLDVGQVDWNLDSLEDLLGTEDQEEDAIHDAAEELVPESQQPRGEDADILHRSAEEGRPETNHSSPPVRRSGTQFLRGSSSSGACLDENTPMEYMAFDDRPFIIPAGDDSFDPSACIKRIGMECIGPYFKVGWTTMETCDTDAPEKWFEHFKTIVKWDPIHTHQIKQNFRRKCSKIISDAWYSMRRRKSKGPKWATPDQRDWARNNYLDDALLEARSARNKINYLGLKSGRGPSKHVLGPKPMTFHKLILEKKLKRQVLPADLYRRAKQRQDGTFVTPDAVTKLKDLDDVAEQVRADNNGADVLPEGELMEATGDVLGFSGRSGLPNLYGSMATLEPSSQWSCNQSTPSVTSQRPQETPMEVIVEKVVEERILPTLSQLQERMDSQPQQFDTRLLRLEETNSRIEESNNSMAEQMRMIIRLLQNSSGGTSQPPPTPRSNT